MAAWRGYDHNGECLDCDEHADAHAPECPFYQWNEAHVARMREELVKANEKVEACRAAAQDAAAKLQTLVDWADARGLLPEHVFTFPDGDTWEAQREPAAPLDDLAAAQAAAIRALRLAAADCECRTCGHVAARHTAGRCRAHGCGCGGWA